MRNGAISEIKFIVDHNVGKLARWLRMMGFDSVFFNSGEDSEMVKQALAENRVILTRDTEILKRRLVTSGRLKAVLIRSEKPEHQMQQLMEIFNLREGLDPFTRCLECNRPLSVIKTEDVKDRVPPYVYKTQSQYMECPACRRIYWRGTHWEKMMKRIEKFIGSR